MAGQARQEADLEVVQGRCVTETRLLARERVRAAEVEYPAPAFSEPRWGAAGERAARPVRETAAARGRPDEEMRRTLLKVAWRVAGVQRTQA